MALGSILWLFPIFVEVCFGNNNTTTHHDGSTHSASLTSIRPSSLVQPNFQTNSSTLLPTATSSTRFLSSLHSNLTNTSTTLLSTSTGFLSSPHSNLTNTAKILIPTSTGFLSTLRLNLTVSTSSVLQSLPTLLSTLHFNLTVHSSSSFVKSMPNGTIFQGNGSFQNEKPMAILQTGSVTSSATLAVLTNHSPSGSIFVPFSSAQFRISKSTKVVNGLSVNSSFVSSVSTETLVNYYQESSSVNLGVLRQGSDKIFVAELRIKNMNFSSELKNKSSSLFQRTALTVTSSIDSVMASSSHYKGCKVVEISNSGIIKIEVAMGPGSSNDPKKTLEPLENAVKSGSVGNLTVDSSHFTRWLKKEPPSRDSLLSGQLAGAALILFILVVLLLIICLGNFVDQPVFDERELFTEEVSMENLGRDRDTQGSEDEEWKFDPLFAWSPRKSFDSKL